MSALNQRNAPPQLIVRHSVSEQVLSELRRRIVRGECPAGVAISEAQYAQSLGVSRVPVREAIMQIERDGLVFSDARGRSIVRAFTEVDHQQVWSVRRELEGLAVRLAAEARTASDLDNFRMNIEAFSRASTPEELAALDVEFHQMLCEASRHQWLLSVWNNLRWPFEAILVNGFRKYVKATSLAESKSSTADHGRIVDALERGNGAEAETLLKQHILRWCEWTP
jgi:DNA-binding GntR family transcriptional regulator